MSADAPVADTANMRGHLLEVAEAVMHRERTHRMIQSDETAEAFVQAKAELHHVMKHVPHVLLAEILTEGERRREKFVVPPDASQPGQVVELEPYSFGKIVMYGFDNEGSFGYLCVADRSGTYRWRYHHRQMQEAWWLSRDPTTDTLRTLASAMRKVLAPETITALVDALDPEAALNEFLAALRREP